jgi:dihydrofolate reductase
MRLNRTILMGKKMFQKLLRILKNKTYLVNTRTLCTLGSEM